MNPASNLALIGPMGSGKTSIGRRLAERFGLQFVDADQYLEKKLNTTVAALFEQFGEAAFRQYETQTLNELLAEQSILLATGGGVILNPVNCQQLNQHSFVVHLHVDVDSQIKRLANDSTRPLLQHPDRLQRLQHMAQLRDPLYRQVADFTFDTSNLDPVQATMQLAVTLASRWKLTEPIHE